MANDTGWVTFYNARVPGGPLLAVQKHPDGSSRTVTVSSLGGHGEMVTNGHINPGRN